MSGKICFLGGARYRQPLDPTSAKKFRALATIGKIFVIGFATDLRPKLFTEHGHFYLLPQLPLPALRYLELFMFGPLVLLWLILCRRVRVIVAQSPYEGYAAVWTSKVAAWFGCRVAVAVEVHGDFENSLFAYRTIRHSNLYKFVMNHTARHAIARADVLRAISNSTEQQLKRWAPDKAIVQFPAWTDIEPFLSYGRKARLHRAQTILYAGVLTPLKGVHHLIAALAALSEQFPNAHLVIAGAEQNKSYVADLRKQVAQLDLASRVQFVGTLPQAELARRMAEASALVLPSQFEGFGRVLLEAMAAGTPVIGSRVGGIPELIDDGITGYLFDPGDEAALAERISRLLEDGEQLPRMGQAAHRFAAQLFSTERYLQGYRELLTMTEATVDGRERAASAV